MLDIIDIISNYCFSSDKYDELLFYLMYNNLIGY